MKSKVAGVAALVFFGSVVAAIAAKGRLVRLCRELLQLPTGSLRNDGVKSACLGISIFLLAMQQWLHKYFRPWILPES